LIWKESPPWVIILINHSQDFPDLQFFIIPYMDCPVIHFIDFTTICFLNFSADDLLRSQDVD